MNELKILKYGENNVRTIQQNGEPWFVLKDVCEVLGIVDHKVTARRLDEDEVCQTPLIDSIGRQQDTTAINESGLYNVILRSDKPEAKPFRKWVTSEVLPSIRKHGMYATDDLINNPDIAIAAFTALKEEREREKQLQQSLNIKNQQLIEMQPKVTYYDVVLQCNDVVSIITIAKDYGWSAKKMNHFLHDKKIIYKQGDIWLAYQKYAEQGYTHTKTCVFKDKVGEEHSKVHTYWTQKGRLFLYNELKSDGIYPLIESETAKG